MLRSGWLAKSLATHSFDTDSPHKLVCFGGPRLPRPLACAIACITRASIKTLAGFEAQLKCLVKAVFENQCLASSAGHADNAIPRGLGSLAFAMSFLQVPDSGVLPARRSSTGKYWNKIAEAMYESLLASVPPAFDAAFGRRP